jgi:hypothetical protein
MPLPTCLNETVNALRRSELTGLAATLAVSDHYNGKRPFPFHHFCQTNRTFPIGFLAICKAFANQPAPQMAEPLPLPNRLTDNVCGNLARQRGCKNGRSSTKTSATPNRPFPNQRAPRSAKPGQPARRSTRKSSAKTRAPGQRPRPTCPQRQAVARKVSCPTPTCWASPTLFLMTQTGAFTAGELTLPKTCAKRERCKSGSSFSCQRLCQFPKPAPLCLAKNNRTSGHNHDKKPQKTASTAARLTPPSAALARVTKTFAIHQNASRPRHRASVGCMAC